MYSLRTLESANQFANEYEQYVLNNDWCGPAILFNLMKQYIVKDQELLDLGIWTGLSGEYFYKAGLQITGIDGAEEMIKLCRKKGFTKDLYLHDLANGLPNMEKLFDHVISFALFHMIEDLSVIFQGVLKALKPNGYFSFSIIQFDKLKDHDFHESIIKGIYKQFRQESGIWNFRHSYEYILDLIESGKLKIIDEKAFIGFKNKEEDREVLFKLFITQKN